jgi:biopolymer transport protein ExbD
MFKNQFIQKRKKRPINASSMADIAFLLLIFFLVTTTMNIDQGLLVLLPPYNEHNIEQQSIKKRNILNIRINGKDQLLVNGQPMSLSGLRTISKKFIDNHGVNPKYAESPLKAVLSLQNHTGTSYGRYIAVHNEIKAAYNELRNNYSQQHYQHAFKDLPKKHQRQIQLRYPLRLSEAEPVGNFYSKIP